MPPKVKITKSDIINAGLELIKKEGAQLLNARNLASYLNCSTQPIFSNFTSMEELQKAVMEQAHQNYMDFLRVEAESGKYPKYKAFGMAYIRFAKEERELFKLLFMCDRAGEAIPLTADWSESVSMIMEANQMTREKAELLHLETWVAVHGIAAMIATSFLDLEWDLISNIVSDIYQGLRSKHLAGEVS